MKRPRALTHLVVLFALLASLLGSAIAAAPVHAAASVVVMNNNDSGAGSLRQAIADVDSGGTITFAPGLSGQTIRLGSTLDVNKNLTIDGSSLAVRVTVSGNHSVEVFFIGYVTVTLKSLVIANGNDTYGGGIYNYGTLTVTNCTLSGNSATYGGAISSWESLTVTNSTFSGNSAYGSGGGIYASAVYGSNLGTLTVTDSTFSGNSAGSNGGGISNQSNILIVTSSTFSGNSAGSNGGGINNDYSGTLTVTSSTFLGNSAGSNGGGIYNGFDYSNQINGTLDVTNSTFSGNHATYSGGGIGNQGALAVTNSTFSGNSAPYGGGIDNAYNPYGPAPSITNTILANSTGGDDYGGGICPSPNTNNLVESGYCSWYSTSDPLLGALGSNGGPTQTFALLPGSPAIGAGDPTSCPSYDQRGYGRWHCDIGAFESQGFTLTVDSGSPQSVPINTAFAGPLQVSVTSYYGDPVDGGVVTFTAPGSGASAALSSATATISGGMASVTATANATAGGPYTVDANAAGAFTGASFSLTNAGALDTSIGTKPSNPSNSTSASFSFSGSGGVGTRSFECKLDSATFAACTSPKSYTGLADGSHTFQVRAKDSLSNVDASPASYPWTVDTTAPDTLIDTKPANPSVSAAASFSFHGDDGINGSGIASYECKLDTAAFAACSSPKSYTALAEGSHIFQVQATDNAGHTDATPASYTWTVDTSPAATTGTAALVTGSTATLNGSVNAHGLSTTVTFEYGLTASYGSTVTAAQSPVTGATDTAVSAALTGLVPNTTYHFRVKAVNTLNSTPRTTLGLDQTFTTLNIAVTVQLYDATPALVTYAPLEARVHAAAAVTGGGAAPTGQVDFTAYPNPSCSGSGTTAGTQTITLGAAGPSLEAVMTVDGLSFKAHYSGDATYPATDSACAGLSTSPYLTVLVLSSSTHPQDGAVLAQGLSSLVIQFDRDVYHANASSAHSATNPANYLLVARGANKDFDTLSCQGGQQTDDARYSVDAVSYDASSYQATLKVNQGEALPPGSYRLFVCGTTSITDPGEVLFLNNHAADSIVSFTVQASSSLSQLPETGFAPDRITLLGQQPAEKAYSASGMTLVITSLGISAPILGVPRSGDSWDLSWLGEDAGYLAGSAYPTWAGSTVLTGHVWNADNTPGIFARIKELKYGDTFELHAFGQVYTYAVRENVLVDPSAVRTVFQPESRSWVTLLTCEGYDASSSAYVARRAVRAVLVAVQ